MSQAETTMALAGSIMKNFDRVNLIYIDVIEDDMEEYLDIDEFFRKNGMKLPLVVINGEPRPELNLTYEDIATAIKMIQK